MEERTDCKRPVGTLGSDGNVLYPKADVYMTIYIVGLKIPSFFGM